MGSGKQLKTRTHITMAEGNKSILNKCKKMVCKLFKGGKEKVSKETKPEKNVKNEETVIIQPLPVAPVAVPSEKRDQEESDEEDELKQFTHLLIVEEPRVSIESQSSVDSGFTEKGTDNEKENDSDKTKKETDDLTEKLKDLKVETESQDKKTNKKTIQTVRISRGPIRPSNHSAQSKSHPYTVQNQDDLGFRQSQNFGQIQSQINPQTLSGGRVIVNETKHLAKAVNEVNQSVEDFTGITEDEQEFNFSVAHEYVNNELTKTMFDNYPTNPLSPTMYDELNSLGSFSPETIQFQQNTMQVNAFDPTLNQLNYMDDALSLYSTAIFPTPPRSEPIRSPMSDLFLQTSSDYSLSPPTSSPAGNLGIDGCRQVVDSPYGEEEMPKPPKKKEEISHNMKYYKDLQKELSNKFSKNDCCQKIRRNCKAIFLKYVEKLQKEERASISMKIANMELQHVLAVLRYLIVQLSKGVAIEDTQIVVFCLICNRMLMEKPGWFVEDFGLELIKLAALRCYSKPFVTRFLVECARAALKAKQQGAGDNPYVFKELDAQGDNLLHACVRKGDVCADVLYELVYMEEASDVPLFNVHHSNSDGYMPLHLACNMHSTDDPRLRVAHVLIEHAGADLLRLDVKGGDTALHLAVNSRHCDLNLIMVLFHHFERSEWKGLAQAQNRSSITARDYARSASRSRPNYPPEVLEFLKKCR